MFRLKYTFVAKLGHDFCWNKKKWILISLQIIFISNIWRKLGSDSQKKNCYKIIWWDQFQLCSCHTQTNNYEQITKDTA